MNRIHPITPRQATESVANRLGGVADRVRQIATNLGVRNYRCFLHWTKWTGKERGDGFEETIELLEILPTPLVKSLDSVTFSIFHAGTVPEGSVRVDEISLRWTEDELRGFRIPTYGTCEEPIELREGDSLKQPFDFFYEVVEDGRGDRPPTRNRFRLMNKPFRRADMVMWSLMLERSSPDTHRGRKGESTFEEGQGESDR